MDLTQLAKKIENCLQSDRHKFRQRLSRLKKQTGHKGNVSALKQLEDQILISYEKVEQRKKNIPEIAFPVELPISGKREEISKAISENQVVIICGETGSGKSTQLPKICLDMGRGVTGLIGHTQPRRIAARTVAARVADELKSQLGKLVGYKIRFSDQVGSQTAIKVMTDGILLAETQGDRFLNAYDTLIIDEAHERSLNIDFLIGYLKTLLPKRPDLKIIITSATIDPERFSRHFNNAPIIEVSGRTFPVELRYRPLIEPGVEGVDNEKELQQGIKDAVDEISHFDQGDILIFLSGERDIRETMESLRKQNLKNTEVIALYAKQGTAEQNLIFQAHKKRHIILATNVAETSLTVPGIRYVIDPGFARISRYNPRSKVQRLPIENISQASANQRKGRCGRVSEGICIRLYSEEDFNARPMFTDPEIKRTSLASVILQLSSLRFGDIEEFPFVEPPEGRYINDGYKLLEELGAVDSSRNITSTGKKLAKLPVDPRIGRMILAAHDQNCMTEILIIASALSVQDVRDKPMEKMQQADEAHAKFSDEDSDFIWFLNLWAFYQQQKEQLSQNKLRKLCRTNFLNYMRMREWIDIHKQLKGLAGDLGFLINKEPADIDAVHRALLSGLLGNIGFLSDRKEYTGARGVKFFLFPGSGQFKKTPKWMMSTELVETTKLYARINAKVEPEWVIKIAGELVKRSYSDAYWSKKSGRVLAIEKVVLYGLILSADRKVNFAPIDPAESRRLFIQGALVNGETHSRLDFFKHNKNLLVEIEAMEHRSRRLDILIDDQTQFDFYDQKIPQNVNNVKGLEKWYREIVKQHPQILFFDRDFLIREDAERICDQALPETISILGMELPLNYHLKPGSKDDGVTLSVPMAVLNQLHPDYFDWLVPGLIGEKITELIRSLPKQLRRNFVPAPNFSEACCNSLPYREGNLFKSVSEHLKKMTGIQIKITDWEQTKIPVHLRMNFRIIDTSGKVVSEGRDLDRLQGKLIEKVEQTFSDHTYWEIEQDDVKSWNFGDLPEIVEITRHGMPLRGYPALVFSKGSISIRVQDTKEKALNVNHQGLIKLIEISIPEQMKYLSKNLPGFDQMCLLFSSVGKQEQLRDDLVNAIIDQTFLFEQTEIRNQNEFNQRLEKGRSELIPVANDICRITKEVLQEFHKIKKRLSGKTSLSWLSVLQEIQQQLDYLIYPGFVSQTNLEWLEQVPRYLKAIDKRLDKLDRDPAKDKSLSKAISKFWMRYTEQGSKTEQYENYRWMIEELRVSLFAQELGTSCPVSEKRLEKLWAQINSK
ncbi:MAG: ATP-dependent RNA helicase HrpA [Gammaproteobacteria bacterium]